MVSVHYSLLGAPNIQSVAFPAERVEFHEFCVELNELSGRLPKTAFSSTSSAFS